jgi:hypothetical protein
MIVNYDHKTFIVQATGRQLHLGLNYLDMKIGLAYFVLKLRKVTPKDFKICRIIQIFQLMLSTDF